MHKKIQNKISTYLSWIKQANDTEADLELCEQLFPNDNIWIDSDINISWLAKSMDEVKERLRILAKRGIMIKEVIESDTKPMWRLKGLYVDICLFPNWHEGNEEGATCRLVQVGSEPQPPRPIFKLICDEKGGN
jgi:hypothetical protein